MVDIKVINSRWLLLSQSITQPLCCLSINSKMLYTDQEGTTTLNLRVMPSVGSQLHSKQGNLSQALLSNRNMEAVPALSFIDITLIFNKLQFYISLHQSKKRSNTSLFSSRFFLALTLL